ncbi:MAG: hypothetical protein R2883_05030 [Caldisericia bacterium]
MQKVRTVKKPRELAKRMSSIAKLIKESIIDGLELEENQLILINPCKDS